MGTFRFRIWIAFGAFVVTLILGAVEANATGLGVGAIGVVVTGAILVATKPG